jgi:hypothetical protein
MCSGGVGTSRGAAAPSDAVSFFPRVRACKLVCACAHLCTLCVYVHIMCVCAHYVCMCSSVHIVCVCAQVQLARYVLVCSSCVYVRIMCARAQVKLARGEELRGRPTYNIYTSVYMCHTCTCMCLDGAPYLCKWLVLRICVEGVTRLPTMPSSVSCWETVALCGALPEPPLWRQMC